ncbi:MAG: chemotaxis protein CheW, partial [Rhodospirillaceae bacterium]
LVCARINELLRRVFHACQHYGLEKAGDLSIALVDMFARVEMGALKAGQVLQRFVDAYLEVMGATFGDVRSGRRPDFAPIERLLTDAADVGFVISGTETAATVGDLLGLPLSFLKVLTPDSVKSIRTALDMGQHFYIVRVNLTGNAMIAANFYSWIKSGAAQAISNLTVFDGDITLFDFLLSSPLGERLFDLALNELDPLGQALRIERALIGPRGNAPVAPSFRPECSEPELAATHDAPSGDTLEAVGEIVTGLAMIHHMLADLIEDDLARPIIAELRRLNSHSPKVEAIIRHGLASLTQRIEEIVKLESRLNSVSGRLQEEVVALRSRPAKVVLRPLVALLESRARQDGRQVAITTEGDDQMIDVTTLESLDQPLRLLASFCLGESLEPPVSRHAAGKSEQGRLRIGVSKANDHVAITLEDDGAGIDLARVTQRVRRLGWKETGPLLDAIMRRGYGVTSNFDAGSGVDFAEFRNRLRAKGGDLRITVPLAGGLRFHMTVPLSAAVLDAMVARVGRVLYVLPIEIVQRILYTGKDAMMQVSAERGRHMLRLSRDEVLPVHYLKKSRPHGNELHPDIFCAPENFDAAKTATTLFVIIGNEAKRVALVVDELLGQHLVMIRPLQGYLSGIRGVSGCALLGGGEVGMVLDQGSVLSKA